MERYAGDGDEVVVDRTWWSWDGAHGGVVVGHLLAAMAGTGAPGPVARAVHAHLLRPVDDRPLRLQRLDVARGRSTATVAARALQGGRLVATATAVFGPAGPGPTLIGRRAPGVPPAERCDVLPLPLELVPFAQHLEIRPATTDLPLGGGDSARLTAWLRLLDDRPVDAATAVVLVDALPPALYATLTRPVPIPTVELSVHLAGRLTTAARPGWVLADIRTEQAGGGWAVDDAALFDAAGDLLATGRQTRRILAPVDGGTGHGWEDLPAGVVA